jgi:hypothetical protein
MAAWENCFIEMAALVNFVELCVLGLQTSLSQKKLLETVLDLQKKGLAPERFPSEEDYLREQNEAEMVETFAKKQRDKGFPYLYSLATVTLWSILETMVDDIAIEYLQNPQECPDSKLLSELKGPLLEFVQASPEERAEFLAGQLKQAVRASLHKGAERFESILKPIGLDGAIPDIVKKSLFELSEVRNVFVHRRGVADKRFRSNCPWFDAVTGKEISLTSSHFMRFHLASFWYALEMEARVARRGNKAPDESYIESQKESLQRLEKVPTSTAHSNANFG